MKISSTAITQDQKIKCLIYGPSKAGKTRTAATLDGATLIIDAEKGLLTLRDFDIPTIKLYANENDVELREPAERIARLSEVFKYLHAGCPDSEGKPTWKYKNIFVDSLTEISELLVQKLNKEFPDRKDSFPMWGEYLKVMRSIVKNFRDLPYNVFMTCLAEPDKDDTGKRFMGFAISGSLASKLPQYFDEVFYVHVDKDGKRSLLTRSTDTIICADRSGKLSHQEPPDLGVIVRKIRLEEKK